MQVTTIGLDIATKVVQGHGVDEHGRVVLRKRPARAKVLAFFAHLPRCLMRRTHRPYGWPPPRPPCQSRDKVLAQREASTDGPSNGRANDQRVKLWLSSPAFLSNLAGVLRRRALTMMLDRTVVARPGMPDRLPAALGSSHA
jgi:hypothetical protein